MGKYNECIYVYIHMDTYMHTCIFAYVHKYVYVYINIHANMCIYVRICNLVMCIYTHVVCGPPQYTQTHTVIMYVLVCTVMVTHCQ